MTTITSDITGDDLICEAKERAAIIAVDMGCTDATARAYTAKLRGFDNWHQMMGVYKRHNQK